MLSDSWGRLVVVYGGVARLLVEVAAGVITMIVGGDEEDGGDGVKWCRVVVRMVGRIEWRGSDGGLMGDGSEGESGGSKSLESRQNLAGKRVAAAEGSAKKYEGRGEDF
ncbi:hypothetical protein Tco_1072100 [Tanacetum coccineum]